MQKQIIPSQKLLGESVTVEKIILDSLTAQAFWSAEDSPQLRRVELKNGTSTAIIKLEELKLLAQELGQLAENMENQINQKRKRMGR